MLDRELTRRRGRPRPSRATHSLAVQAGRPGRRGRVAIRRRVVDVIRPSVNSRSSIWMGRRPVLTALAAASVAALATFTGAFASVSADPGITSTSIVLGGTSPLTGPAAAYASVARGAKAYLDFVNAKGG